MSEKFPVYPIISDHSEAQCFNCAGPVTHNGVSGSAIGMGAFVAYCQKCDMRTWYDLRIESLLQFSLKQLEG